MALNAPAINPQDSALQLRVKVELRINGKTESFAKSLRISVRGGIVSLEGQAPSETDARNAERVALGVAGVVNVVNKLEVSQ